MLWWTILKLKSQDPDERMRSIEELGRIEGRRAADALASVLQDENWEIRAAAIRALISRGDPRGPSYLTQLLGSRWNTKAADLFVSIGHQGVEPLVAAVSRQNFTGLRTIDY